MEMTELVTIFKYFILGLIQGFTEPIPVSSSGHVIIGQKLLGVKETGLTFEILTNTASLFAICFIFRDDIKRIIVHTYQFIFQKKEEGKSDFMFALYIVIGTIPAAVLGVLFSDVIANLFKSPYIIGITLLITGTALWLIRNLRGKKRDGDLSIKDALVVGLAQAVALIPGISRSGATVITSIAVGMKQDTALRFSFMLYIPVSLGGMILGISDLIKSPDLSSLALPYFVAFMAALVMTYFAMRWFMGIMAKGNLKYFAYYCFVVGTLLLFFSSKLS